MQPTNLLSILSDQHNRNLLGCYVHQIASGTTASPTLRRNGRITQLVVRCTFGLFDVC